MLPDSRRPSKNTPIPTGAKREVYQWISPQSRFFGKNSPLPDRLESRSRARGRDIEGSHLPPHGQPRQDVATLPDEPTDALSFRPKDEGEVPGQVQSIKIPPLRVEADDLKPLILKVIEKPAEVSDPRDRHPLHSSGGTASNRLGQGCGSSLGDGDPSSDRLGDPEDGSEILRILNLVEHEKETGPALAHRRFRLRKVFPSGEARDCTLVLEPAGPGERIGTAIANRNLGAAAETLQLVDSPIPPLGVKQHPLDLAGPGAKRLLDWMETGQNHDNRELRIVNCGWGNNIYIVTEPPAEFVFILNSEFLTLNSLQ